MDISISLYTLPHQITAFSPPHFFRLSPFQIHFRISTDVGSSSAGNMCQISSSSLSLSARILFISTSLLSAAIMLKLSAPSIADSALYEVPSLYNGVVSWLRPPYLYLVINCIIVTILASSKLHSDKDDVSVPLDYPAAEYKYENVVVLGDCVVKEEKGLDFGTEPSGNLEDARFPASCVNSQEDAMDNKENVQFKVANSMWNAEDNKDLTEYSPSDAKPPVSARFSRRKIFKTSPEGGKTVLGVSKAKRQNTWKTITEGRAMPLTRHLRNSDTWERDGHTHGHDSRLQYLLHHQDIKTPQKKMTKAETFQDRTKTKTMSPASSGGSRKLRESSLTQDELHRRVEAFIKKFNEDMRLQRQESLNQYTEMIKRSSH